MLLLRTFFVSPLPVFLSLFFPIPLSLGFLGLFETTQLYTSNGASGKEHACQCRRHRRWGSIPGWQRSPGGGHANPSSILAWEVPGTEDSGGLWSIGSQRVRYDRSDIASRIYANPIWRKLSEGATPSLWHLQLVQSSRASPGGPSHCLLGVSRPCSSAPSFYCTVNNGNQHLSTIPGLGVVGCLWNPQRYNPFSLYSCWPRLKQFYHIKIHIKTW